MTWLAAIGKRLSWAVLGAVIALALLIGYGRELFGVDLPRPTALRRPAPRIVETSKVIEKWRTKTETREIVVHVPYAEKAAEKAEDKFGLKLSEQVAEKDRDSVLGAWDIPVLEWGGEAVAALKPDGTTSLFLAPYGPPLFALGGRRSWRGFVERSVGSGPDGLTTGLRLTQRVGIAFGLRIDGEAEGRFDVDNGEAGATIRLVVGKP